MKIVKIEHRPNQFGYVVSLNFLGWEYCSEMFETENDAEMWVRKTLLSQLEKQS